LPCRLAGAAGAALAAALDWFIGVADVAFWQPQLHAWPGH